MTVFSRMLGLLQRTHLLWCLIWAQVGLTASAEWRLEQRTLIDGNPGLATAQTSGLGNGNGWADAAVGSSPDSLRLEYESSLPIQNGGSHPKVEFSESRTTEAAGSYTLGIPDLASITGSYHQKEGRYPLAPIPPTLAPQTWSNGGCALVYWRRHTGVVRAIAWANGDFFDDAESRVHLDGLLVSTIFTRPCPQSRGRG